MPPLSARHIWITVLTVAAITGVCLLYYYFDPSEGIGLKCLFKTVTGYDCPGCGMQRALHAMVHLRLSEAWSYNPFLFFIVPLAGCYIVSPYIGKGVNGRFYGVLYDWRFVMGVAVAIIAWWIGRNL